MAGWLTCVCSGKKHKNLKFTAILAINIQLREKEVYDSNMNDSIFRMPAEWELHEECYLAFPCVC